MSWNLHPEPLVQRLGTLEKDMEVLSYQLAMQPEVFSFQSNPILASQIACLGIHKDIDTIHNNFIGFIVDAQDSSPIPKELLRSDLIQYKNFMGVRIWAEQVNRLDLHLAGGKALANPTLSLNADGTFKQFVFFPQSIAKILAREGIELVIAKKWAMSDLFVPQMKGGVQMEYTIWNLEQEDLLLYLTLIVNNQIPLQCSHDLVAHLAGLKGEHFSKLKGIASKALHVIASYLRECHSHSAASLLLPICACILIDELSQPPLSGSKTREVILDELLDAVERRVINPQSTFSLHSLPHTFFGLRKLSTCTYTDTTKTQARAWVKDLANELLLLKK